MGYGSYSAEAHRVLAAVNAARSQAEVFAESACHPSLNPYGVRYRESRDSAAHSNSVGIVFALDVSGSMGEIPVQLAQKTLPTFMESVTQVLPSAQVMFIAFGNAYADRSPLQVGQFESEAKLIDKWLSTIHLEGGGGGLGESYDLAMYFAARHTAMDCLAKRNKKGYFIMTGDEPPFVSLDAEQTRRVIGGDVREDIAVHHLAGELLRSFHVFFLIPDAARAAQFEVELVWRRLFHERTVILDRPEDTAVVSALLVGIQEGKLPDAASLERQLEEGFGRKGAERDRLVRIVLPYAEALTRGTFVDPEPLGVAPPNSMKG
jgi:hypothetical protein